jgi:hypothetical protein
MDELGTEVQKGERGGRELKENSKGRGTEILTSGKGRANGKERGGGDNIGKRVERGTKKENRILGRTKPMNEVSSIYNWGSLSARAIVKRANGVHNNS